mmetsp:Transcript_4108/g.6616  ORF Transcript_4108/g.6616 Transcript_4108/m.6616 type:complete len:119 (-) Transcript_4108:20-376(-)
MKVLCAAFLITLVKGAFVAVQKEGEDCDDQERFNVYMCESHMCTDCTLAWCTEKCQELQLLHPDCRCSSWPASRKTFSSGDFEGKGKFGDSGDYAKGEDAGLIQKQSSKGSLQLRGHA